MEVQTAPKYTWIPFGAGPRVCIGEGFARMEMSLVLATLLKRLRFESVGDAPTPRPAFLLRPKEGVRLRVCVRDGAGEEGVRFSDALAARVSAPGRSSSRKHFGDVFRPGRGVGWNPCSAQHRRGIIGDLVGVKAHPFGAVALSDGIGDSGDRVLVVAPAASS